MFHQGTPSFRAWLGAFARELPRAPRRLRDELGRLGARLAASHREAEALRRALDESERDRADRLALIHRLQAESAERAETAGRLAAEGAELRAYAARVEAALAEREAESAARLGELERLASDRRQLHAHVARVEAALEEARRERESWLAVLPGLRLRLPGGAATAERLRAMRRRLSRRPRESEGRAE